MARMLVSLGALLAAGPLQATDLLSTSAVTALSTQASPRTLKTRFTYKASVLAVPSGTKQLRLWLPIPSDNTYQKVSNLSVSSPVAYRITTEKRFGNRMVFLESASPGKSLDVAVSFEVDRKEAAPLAGGNGMNGDEDLSMYLKPDKLVPTGGRYAELAKEIVGNKTSQLDQMRAVYEHTVANMQYDYKKESPKLGEGDVAFVCDYKKGNCSDLHSYMISLARTLGIPCVLEFGFPVCGVPVPASVPKSGTIGGYHCWLWFHLEDKGWLVLDASDGRRWTDANKPEVRDRLFGNLVVERSAVAVSRGRDVVLEPAQKAGPLNNFIYPYAEADGDPVEAKWVMEYELLSPAGVIAAPSGTLEEQVADLRKLVLTQQDEIAGLRAALAAKTGQPDKPGQAVMNSTKQKVSTYGFVRTDAIFDSHSPNPNGQIPFYIESPDRPGIGSDSERFTLHPRLTRVGFDYAGADPDKGWQLSGKAEFDFQGGGSESRQTPRARHLYLQIKRGTTSVLAGQTWEVISPLFPSPNDDTLMWNAGNLGDRRPQVRVTHDAPDGALSLAVALGLTGAVDAKDLDNNGIRDGEDSGAPNVQARVAWKGPKGHLGVWGHTAKERTKTPVGGETSFESEAVGADARFLVGPNMDLSAEVWSGRNLSDVRGGVGQGVNTTTGKEIRSSGGWVELGMRSGARHRAAIGYTVDNPKDADVPAGGRTKNYAYYLHNKWALSEPIDLGINLLYWVTEYSGMRKGKDLRLNVFAAYKY